MRLFLGCLLAWFWTDSIVAQTNLIDRHYLHRIWQFEDGLPQNTVLSVTQTRDGYIWAGTQNGLVRFDGVRFVVFNDKNTPEIKNPIFTCLMESRDGSLWMGTQGGGLNRYKDGRFERYTTTNGLAGNYIRAIYETRDGTLWISTIDGLCRGKDGRFSKVQPEAPFTNIVVRSFHEAKDGCLWMAANESGLFSYQNGVLSQNKKVSQMPSGKIRAIRMVCEDSKGHLWYASTESVHRMKADGSELENISATQLEGMVNSLFEDAQGNLWIGTFGGLFRYREGNLYQEVTGQGMSLDVVNSICQDSEGNLWVASKEGLNRLKPRLFQAYTRDDGLAGNNIMSVLEKDGGLWVATWGGGLSFLQNDQATNLPPSVAGKFKSNLPLAMEKTKDGALWVGFDFDHGIAKIKDGQVTVYRESKLLKDPAVRVIFEDSRTNLWIGMRTALYLMKDGAVTRFNKSSGLAGDMVRVILEDRRGNIWFGTSGGLTRRTEGKFTNFTTRHGLADNMIVALHEDSDGVLWIGTMGGGLTRYRDGKFTSYGSREGLFRDEVFDILEDDFGHFWMTCRLGIFRVNKKDFDDFDAGRLPAIRCTAYGKHEGLISLECNSVAKPTALKTGDGRLWFCTAKGLVVIDPGQSYQVNEVPPVVMIEEVLVNKQPLTDERLPIASFSAARALAKNVNRSLSSPVSETASGIPRLPPSRGELEIHYTALSFSAPEQNHFRYKLEGFDENWVDAGTRRVAYYSNLRPGRYIFRVEGYSSEGVWAAAKSPVTFELEPYFYQTKLFFVGCVASVILLGVGVHRIRVRQLHRNEENLHRLIEARTKDLKDEIVRREKAQAEIEQVHRQLVDASRQAGMAEVASGVLHNVGNVLNSVNVAATFVMDQVRNSRQSGLRKVAALLQENQSNLPDFFTRDSRSQKIPEYLEKLSEQLGREQTMTLKELEALCKNIDHIKDIVAMQQTYARVSGVMEKLPLSDLIEDSLRFNAATLMRHDIQVIRQWEKLPAVVTDKHKVIQILVNLISNAKFACDDSGRTDKCLIISARIAPNNCAQIVVKDNGVGIAPENMTRIFSHGFTTRANGHGFGLHSAAIAAKEMGGVIAVHSDGPGKGATFTLEFPIEPPSTRS